MPLAEGNKVVPELDHGGNEAAHRLLQVAVADLSVFHHDPKAGHAVRREPGEVAVHRGEIAAARDLKGFVLGLPVNMDGSEGPRAQSTRAFARNLERLTDLPITFWDERLSTVAAERALLEADMSRRRRAETIDHVAAGFILQGMLDRLGHLEERDDG